MAEQFYNQTEWYTPIKQTIAANSDLKINKYARFITLLSSTGGSEDIAISINNQRQGILEQGISIELPPFTQFNNLKVFNLSGSPVTVTVALSNGRVVDSRLNLTAGLTVASPQNLTTVAGVAVVNAAAAAVIMAQNSDRREAFITNLDVTNAIYIGDANTDAGAAIPQGVKLDAGQTIVLETKAAIYAQNESGANVNVGLAYTS